MSIFEFNLNNFCIIKLISILILILALSGCFVGFSSSDSNRKGRSVSFSVFPEYDQFDGISFGNEELGEKRDIPGEVIEPVEKTPVEEIPSVEEPPTDEEIPPVEEPPTGENEPPVEETNPGADTPTDPGSIDPGSSGEPELDPLVAHWSMDRAQDLTVVDDSGNGYTALLVNGATLVPSKGVYMDGIDDYMYLGNVDVAGNQLTISAWVNAESFSQCPYRDCRILSKAIGLNDNDHYFMLSTMGVGTETYLRFRVKTGTGTSVLIATSYPLVLSQWYHVAEIYDGTRMLVYVNGELAGSLAKQGELVENSEVSVWIGANPSSDIQRPWQGEIDDIKIYRIGLSPNELNEQISLSPHAAGPE